MISFQKVFVLNLLRNLHFSFNEPALLPKNCSGYKRMARVTCLGVLARKNGMKMTEEPTQDSTRCAIFENSSMSSKSYEQTGKFKSYKPYPTSKVWPAETAGSEEIKDTKDRKKKPRRSSTIASWFRAVGFETRKSRPSSNLEVCSSPMDISSSLSSRRLSMRLEDSKAQISESTVQNSARAPFSQEGNQNSLSDIEISLSQSSSCKGNVGMEAEKMVLNYWKLTEWNLAMDSGEIAGQRRIEEWIDSIDSELDVPEENNLGEELEWEKPASPHATEISLRLQHEERLHKRKDKESASEICEAETISNPDMEVENAAVQSLNPLCSVAHISGVGLKCIPPLESFASLKSLCLSANSIVKIDLGRLPRSLHFLDLSRNKIAAVDGLRNLDRLRVLNLSYNLINRIGHGLARCTSLKELYLAGNRISEVEGLHRLRKLQLVDLSYNKLNTTRSLGQLAANYSRLRVLNLVGNAIVQNLGEEQLQRFVNVIAPNLVYLNTRALRPVPAREAVSGQIGSRRAASCSLNRSSHWNNRAKRIEALKAASRPKRKL